MKQIIEKIIFLKDFYKYLIFISLWAVIGIILYFLVINPQYAKIKKKKVEYLNVKRKTLMIVRVKKKLDKFKKEFENVKKEYKLAVKKLPNKREIPNLLLKISSYGKENNLNFLFFRPHKEIKKEFYAIIPISLKFTGTYANSGNFFYEIGKTTRIVKIKKFSVKKRMNNTILINAYLETYKFIKNYEKKKKRKK